MNAIKNMIFCLMKLSEGDQISRPATNIIATTRLTRLLRVKQELINSPGFSDWGRNLTREASNPIMLVVARNCIEEIIAEGDKVMTRASMSGVQKGALEGIPPTGKTINISIFTVFRVVNGKIAEEWEIYDSLGMMQQLGMELRPKEPERK